MEPINPCSSGASASEVWRKGKKAQFTQLQAVLDEAAEEEACRQYLKNQSKVETAMLYSYDYASALKESPMLLAHQCGGEFVQNLNRVPPELKAKYLARTIDPNQAAATLGTKALRYITDCLSSRDMDYAQEGVLKKLSEKIATLATVAKKSDEYIADIQADCGEKMRKAEANMNSLYAEFHEKYHSASGLSPSDATELFEKSHRCSSFVTGWDNEMRFTAQTEKKRQDLEKKCKILIGKNLRMQLELNSDAELPEYTAAKSADFRARTMQLDEAFGATPSKANWECLQETLRQALCGALDDEERGACAISLDPSTALWKIRYKTMLEYQKPLDEAEQKAKQIADELLAAECSEMNLKQNASRKGKGKISQSSRKNAKEMTKPNTVPAGSEARFSIAELHPSSSSSSALEQKIALAMSSRKKGIQFEGEMAKYLVQNVAWSSFDMNVFDVKNNRRIAEYDFEFPFVRVEVTLRPDGKKAQIQKRLLSLESVNSDRRPTILYAPNYTKEGIQDIAQMIKNTKKKGIKVAPFFFANTHDDLHDLLYTIHCVTNVPVTLE